MHVVFLHLFPSNKIDTSVYQDLIFQEIEISILQRSNTNSQNGNLHLIKDEFDLKLKWWQNSETLNNYVGELNPDMVYIFGLNLPLHYRWLKHYISPNTILVGQHCGENIWIQRNLWLQQSALRVVDGFVFPKRTDANPWLKCAAVVESQPIFEIENFRKDMFRIYNNLLKNKTIDKK